MAHIYVPSVGAESWRSLLADPEKHWKTGFSAKTLAHAWESAGGLPPEISRLFGANAELLLALPEHWAYKTNDCPSCIISCFTARHLP
jgi:hypothetical protein